LSQVKVVRGIGDGCDEEAIIVVKLSSPWKPGMQNGRAVRVAYSLPVSFMLNRQ
jgi:protein TonB